MARTSVTIRIEFDGNNAIGPGKISLLERMRESGSLSQAARDLDMSYRRAWQLLDALNRSFKEPVVLTAAGGTGGGGTTLTPLGEEIISAYRALERDMSDRVESVFASISAAASRAPSGARRSLSRPAAGSSPRTKKTAARKARA